MVQSGALQRCQLVPVWPRGLYEDDVHYAVLVALPALLYAMHLGSQRRACNTTFIRCSSNAFYCDAIVQHCVF